LQALFIEVRQMAKLGKTLFSPNAKIFELRLVGNPIEHWSGYGILDASYSSSFRKVQILNLGLNGSSRSLVTLLMNKL